MLVRKARQHQTDALDATKTINEGIIHLPTGTGKSYIQSLVILDKFKNTNNSVYVVLTPRILLTNQLFKDVKNELSIENDCQYLIVHSGKGEKSTDKRDINSTTSPIKIKEDYERAQRENVNLIIFATYDSAYRIIEANIPVYMLLCDEAHYIVREENAWIKFENYNNDIKQFNAKYKFYFTATLKESASDKGIGMNNVDEFGPIIYSKSPLDMVIAGEILRPRMHFVDVSEYHAEDELDSDVNAIIESFIEHRIHCKIGAKILVVTKGTEHLNNIVKHPKILQELDTRPNLKIFDISSEHKPRINGVIVKREEFLKKLQGLTDTDEAIILHIDILTEGIDVPGITGVMIFENLKLAKFLQTLGRATRLHPKDREKLYNGLMTYNELHKFIKSYAWIIIPVYGIIGEDLRKSIQEMVYGLRTFGFNASEDCVIKQSRGKAIPVPLSGINDLDTRGIMYRDILLDIVHEVEDKVIADQLNIDDFRLIETIKNESIEDTINRFSNF
jgi:superfamily II DNA or RNA helicase